MPPDCWFHRCIVIDHHFTFCVQGDASECIEYLLQEGADRTLRDVNRRRPIDFARYKNYGECIAQLSMGDKVRLT